MTTYYPVASQQAGDELSARLWYLCRPPETRDAKDTQRLYAVVQDLLGNWWMEVPDDHATVVLSAQLTQAQIDAAVNAIETQEDLLP